MKPSRSGFQTPSRRADLTSLWSVTQALAAAAASYIRTPAESRTDHVVMSADELQEVPVSFSVHALVQRFCLSQLLLTDVFYTSIDFRL